MTNELSKEGAIEALYTVRAYYASLTAGYPKGKDCKGIGDVMCSEIANSCLMAIKALESQRWIPVSEKPQEGRYLCTYEFDGGKCIDFGIFDGDAWYIKPLAYMPLPTPYKESDENETN